MAAKQAQNVTVNAIELEQNGQKFYLCGLTAKQLSTVASVNLRDPVEEKGYQRLFVESHIQAIRKFLDQGNCIPVSVLATFKGAEFTKGKLTLKGGRKNGWIIDGQHRWLAARELSKDIMLPVIAFINLSISKQVEHFIAINREARGVPSSLYLDLLKSLPKEKSVGERAKERATDIARGLNADEESPFYGKIVVLTSPKKGIALRLPMTDAQMSVLRRLNEHGDFSIRRNDLQYNDIWPLDDIMHQQMPPDFGRFDEKFSCSGSDVGHDLKVAQIITLCAVAMFNDVIGTLPRYRSYATALKERLSVARHPVVEGGPLLKKLEELAA